jgi:hypothetical protein
VIYFEDGSLHPVVHRLRVSIPATARYHLLGQVQELVHLTLQRCRWLLVASQLCHHMDGAFLRVAYPLAACLQVECLRAEYRQEAMMAATNRLIPPRAPLPPVLVVLFQVQATYMRWLTRDR